MMCTYSVMKAGSWSTRTAILIIIEGHDWPMKRLPTVFSTSLLLENRWKPLENLILTPQLLSSVRMAVYFVHCISEEFVTDPSQRNSGIPIIVRVYWYLTHQLFRLQNGTRREPLEFSSGPLKTWLRSDDFRLSMWFFLVCFEVFVRVAGRSSGDGSNY